MKLIHMARVSIAVSALALTFSCSRPAEEPIAEEKPAGKLSPMAALEKRFQDFDLKVGDPFPEAEVYDAEGKPFNTKSLKGKYTVIVNGCLT
jgi:cytochrome oxidase Cu insertion factor (SCO1/SenC/PrrC family)